MKKVTFICMAVMMMCILAGCGKNAGKTDLPQTEEENTPSAETDQASVEEQNADSVFELTESGKSFLAEMCRQLPDFSDETDMNEEFWKNFIFYGYTSSEGELINVYREDMGFDETERKVEAAEVSKYAELALGKELPDIKPAFSDMNELQTALYYEEGYYYIGVSDFPDFQYVFENCEVHEENGSTYAVVTYTVNFEDTENAGTVTMRIIPADNENGFVITSKVTAM